MNALSRPIELRPAQLYHHAAVVALGFLIAAAVTITARRLAGALHDPLESATMLAAGFVFAAAAAVVHFGCFGSAPASVRVERGAMILTSLALGTLAIGLCLPGTPAAGMFFLAVLLAGEESWAWARHVRRRSEASSHRPEPPSSPRAALSFDPEATTVPDDVTQQLVRSQSADGVEELSGWLRLAFADGQRTGSVHVAFCPPFAATPTLEVEQVDGPDARIKTAQLLPYGARLDLKLSAAAAEPTNVLLQFSARTTGQESSDH